MIDCVDVQHLVVGSGGQRFLQAHMYEHRGVDVDVCSEFGCMCGHECGGADVYRCLVVNVCNCVDVYHLLFRDLRVHMYEVWTCVYAAVEDEPTLTRARARTQTLARTHAHAHAPGRSCLDPPCVAAAAAVRQGAGSRWPGTPRALTPRVQAQARAEGCRGLS